MINDIEIKWIKLKRGSQHPTKPKQSEKKTELNWKNQEGDWNVDADLDNMLSEAKLNEILCVCSMCDVCFPF